jgi:hypothetical protein
MSAERPRILSANLSWIVGRWLFANPSSGGEIPAAATPLTSRPIGRPRPECAGRNVEAVGLAIGGPLSCIFQTVILLVLALRDITAVAQDGETVCRQQFKTQNHCYRVYRPAGPARGLVVLLPYYGSDANEFSSAALPKLLAEKNIATMAVSASGYLNDDDLVTLRELIGDVVRELSIPAGSLAVGGISAGGTGAVRYSEYCISSRCDARSTPVAVFSVDAPLDFEAWWNRETLNLRRGYPNSSLEESQGILGALRSAMGGSPNQARQAYRSRSPFLASERDGGNARLLKNVPLRLYTEPDVGWMIDNMGRDYYTMNAVDQAALILQLRSLGNTEGVLITTTGKGFRPPGTRNPHSWTIVDEPGLADWIVGSIRPRSMNDH